MSATANDTKQALQDYVATLGLTYQATFQPRPQPRETVEHPQLNWIITLSKGNQTAQFPYSQGMGHVKGYKQYFKNSYERRCSEACYRKTCETGVLYLPNEYDPYAPWSKR